MEDAGNMFKQRNVCVVVLQQLHLMFAVESKEEFVTVDSFHCA
jgi:hypothetical protein